MYKNYFLLLFGRLEELKSDKLKVKWHKMTINVQTGKKIQQTFGYYKLNEYLCQIKAKKTKQIYTPNTNKMVKMDEKIEENTQKSENNQQIDEQNDNLKQTNEDMKGGEQNEEEVL